MATDAATIQASEAPQQAWVRWRASLRTCWTGRHDRSKFEVLMIA
ncbi:hypothetical protein [Sorangium sp. So ce406]